MCWTRATAVATVTVAGVLVMLAVIGSPPAEAHAFLVRSDAQPGARLGKTPSKIKLYFSEPFVGGSERVSIVSGGKTTALPPPSIHGAVVTQRVPRGLRGVAIVSWRGVADDAHLTAGELAFAVGPGGAVPAVASATNASIRWGQAVLEWVFFAGLALALGGLVSEVAVWRAVGRRVEPPVAAPARIGVALATLSSGLYLVLLAGQGAGGSLLAGLDGGALADAVGSRPGVLTLVVMGALAAADLLVAARRRRSAIGVLVAAVVAVSLRGHAASSGHAWVVAVDAVHLAAAAFWAGALAHLVLVVARSSGEPLRARAVAAVRRYSRLALPTVLLLLVSGVGDALAQFRGLAELVDTSYGRTLLIKSGAVGIALVAAVLARERALPTAVSSLRMGFLRRLTRAELSSAAPPRSSAAAAAAPPPRLGPPPLSGPVLRLGDLAGNIVVGLATNGHELRFTVLPPIPKKTTGIKLKVEIDRPGRPPADLYPRRCGRTCFTMRFKLPGGMNHVDATVAARGWAGGTAHFQVSWPPGRRQPELLRAVTRAMRSVGRLTLTEAVTSGPGSRGGPTTDQTTGRKLLQSGEVYAKGAVDVRVLRRRHGRTELAFALPGSDIWYRMTVDRRRRVLKERIVSPGHLIDRTFRYPG